MSVPKEPAPDTPAPEGQPPRPSIIITPGANPVYANLVRIAHSPSEMVFDFARLLPGDPRAVVAARVVMSPLSAKLLQQALAENLGKYEATFGEIPIPQKQSLADFLFRPPQPPEPRKEDE